VEFSRFQGDTIQALTNTNSSQEGVIRELEAEAQVAERTVLALLETGASALEEQVAAMEEQMAEWRVLALLETGVSALEEQVPALEEQVCPLEEQVPALEEQVCPLEETAPEIVQKGGNQVLPNEVLPWSNEEEGALEFTKKPLKDRVADLHARLRGPGPTKEHTPKNEGELLWARNHNGLDSGYHRVDKQTKQ
jgi:polyhydroxyalkanoate synthesis regulator phasin